MAVDEDYGEGGRLSKRQRVLKKIAESKLSAAALEAIFSNAVGSDKTKSLFAIPPCEIKESDFTQRFGMITITKTMPSYNRFRSIEMSGDTLKTVSDLVGLDVSCSTDSQGPDAGERHDSPIVDRLLRDLGQFTRPRPKEEEQPTYPKPTRDWNDDEKKTGFVVEFAAPPHLDTEKVPEQWNFRFDAGMVPGELKNSQDSGSSGSSEDQDDILVLNERASEASPRQHADWKLFVYKERHSLGGLELKVVSDIKTSASPMNLFQPAMYGIQTLSATVWHPKTFRPPVYLMAHGSNSWFYAILEIDGFMVVKRGQIEPLSLQGFPESPTAVNPKKFTPSMTQSEVSATFEAWKEKMSALDMYVPDGIHPVGRLFLSDNRYEFPSLYFEKEQTLTAGRKRYYDGMLKILVGRRVTKWCPRDAQEAWEKRRNLKLS